MRHAAIPAAAGLREPDCGAVDQMEPVNLSAIRDDWKICLPETYKYLTHNNCIPCFKAGKGHFYKVWRHYPQQFKRAKQMEELVGHTVFKDKPLSELEAEWIASEEQLELDFGEHGVPCMCAV